MALVIWFKTDAFLEYVELLRADMLFGVREFRKQQVQGGNYMLTYPEFLIVNHNSFLIRLITCPTCLTAWASIIISSFIGWHYVPFLFVTAMISFGVISTTYMGKSI